MLSVDEIIKRMKTQGKEVIKTEINEKIETMIDSGNTGFAARLEHNLEEAIKKIESSKGTKSTTPLTKFGVWIENSCGDLTTVEIAERIGVSPTSVFNWKRRNFSEISRQYQSKILFALEQITGKSTPRLESEALSLEGKEVKRVIDTFGKVIFSSPKGKMILKQGLPIQVELFIDLATAATDVLGKDTVFTIGAKHEDL